MTPGRHAAPVVDGEEQSPRDAIRIVRGNPTAEELAAVSTVIAQAIGEMQADAVAEEPYAPSGWARSQRPIRSPLHPGRGRWRNFSANPAQ